MKKILLRDIIRIHSLDGLFLKLSKAQRILSKPLALLLLMLVLIIPAQSHAITYTYTGNPLTDTIGSFYYPDYSNFSYFGGPNPATGYPIKLTLTFDSPISDGKLPSSDPLWSVSFGTTAGTKTLQTGSKDSDGYPYSCAILDYFSVSAAGLPTQWRIFIQTSGSGYNIDTASYTAVSLANQYTYPDPPPYIGPSDGVSAFNDWRGIGVYNLGSPGTWSVTDAPSSAPAPGTILLFASGLVGLAGWRRFRKF